MTVETVDASPTTCDCNDSHSSDLGNFDFSQSPSTVSVNDSQALGRSGSVLSEIVYRGACEMGIALNSEALKAFESYYKHLSERARDFNLTTILEPEDVARLHFLDSMAIINSVRMNGARVIDVGSGAGFPGVPLKLAEPSIDLTLLDATGKKFAFLTDLCAMLGISSHCVHSRAEEAAHKPDMRERYGVAVSRAVARLNTLCELCLPFIQIGGVFVAMKSHDSLEELDEAGGAVEKLGAQFQDCAVYMIPGTNITRRAFIFRKTSSTPDKFPRRFARIQNSPL